MKVYSQMSPQRDGVIFRIPLEANRHLVVTTTADDKITAEVKDRPLDKYWQENSVQLEIDDDTATQLIIAANALGRAKSKVSELVTLTASGEHTVGVVSAN